MTAVIDASVFVASVTDAGEDGAFARSAISQGNIAAPALVLAEAANSLRRLAYLRRISAEHAGLAIDRLLRENLELKPFAPYAHRIWALRDNLTCYDAWYVALAEALDCPVVYAGPAPEPFPRPYLRDSRPTAGVTPGARPPP